MPVTPRTAAPLTVVVPACNEIQTIGAVVAAIHRAVPEAEVVVVDDGSTDGTAAAAGAAGARVLVHPYNKGNGAAVKTALRAVACERIVILDADGQHPPEKIPQLVGLLDTHDLVVGARVAASLAPRHRRLGNWLFCRLAALLSEREIPDLTSGFRALRRGRALEFVHLYPNGFSFPTTSTLSFISAGYSVAFVPIEAAARSPETRSHIRPLRDGLRFVLMIIRITTMMNPLRVFVPAAAVCLLAGVAWSVRTLLLTGQISAAGAFLVGAALNILFFGIVVDQLAAIRLKGRD